MLFSIYIYISITNQSCENWFVLNQANLKVYSLKSVCYWDYGIEINLN